MKGTSVFLDQIAVRRAAARMVDGVLDDFLLDPEVDGPPRPGSLYRGVVERPMKGQGGVFVALPDGERGFLRRPGGLSQGQTLLVQATGYAEPGKAIPLTQKLLFKSKYAIVTPGAPGINPSRAIKDAETRRRLTVLAEDVMAGSAAGLILRSAAGAADEDALEEDIAEMRAQAEAMAQEAAGDPALLLDGPDAHHLAWREWGDPDEVVTEAGCFDERGVLDQLSELAEGRFALPGGGAIWVEATRALIAVDVNTGADGSPAAGLKANLATMRTLPRALRLLGLGGQITVDLAPLVKKDRRQIEQALNAALRADPVETSFVGWTPLGHIELQRKRERLAIPLPLLAAL